jgi:aspartate racemase
VQEKTIGILGGMGPEATLDCFARIIRNTPAEKDQDHLRVVIDSNPKVPDRTAAIIGGGASPVPALVAGCRALLRGGADFIIIPCVSAHFFLSEIHARIDVQILSMFAVVAEAVAQHARRMHTVGLLGTTGTVRGRHFSQRLAEAGIRTIVPDDADQAAIMDCIYDIKNSQPARSLEEIRAGLVEAANHLASRGAQGIVAGCTEIPLALQQTDLSLPYFDSLTLLARAAIRRAGVEPVPIQVASGGD